MATAAPTKVLIIGAGLGGLAFAQCLRKDGIPFEIFERDSAQYSRAQGFALTLHWILNALVTALPPGMPPLRNCVVEGPLNRDSFATGYDAVTKEVLLRFGPDRRGLLRVNRSAFREWLMTNIPVQWGKKFERYEETPTGVTAFFSDGTSVEGSILVGADGVQSKVRKQLLPAAPEPRVIPIGTVVGELVLSRPEYERQQDLSPSMWYASRNPTILLTGLKYVAPDLSSANYYWAFSFMDESVASPESWVHTARKEERLQVALDRMEQLGYRPEFTEIVKKTKPEQLLDPIVYRSLEPQAMPKGFVTLLGDAAHPMTPFRGEGACMALLDGIKLAKALCMEIRGATWVALDTPDIASALKTYEEEMIERNTEAVRSSEAAARTMNPNARLGYDPSSSV